VNRIKQTTPYAADEAYKSEIAKLVKEIKGICDREKIPFFCTFAVSNDENDTVYKNDGLMPPGLGIGLTKDTLKEHALIAGGGFSAKPDGTIGEVGFYEDEIVF
jgi:hypothetical protein